MSKETGGPAYPQAGNGIFRHNAGMTLRDKFAAVALKNLIPDYTSGDAFEDCDDMAEFAYRIADAMLEARK